MLMSSCGYSYDCICTATCVFLLLLQSPSSNKVSSYTIRINVRLRSLLKKVEHVRGSRNNLWGILWGVSSRQTGFIKCGSSNVRILLSTTPPQR